MIYLDLTNLDNSDIKYKISKFPDGQQSITLDKFTFTQRLSSVLIKSRLNSFRDLELIICTNQSLRELGIEDVNLYIPYFLGARSDRKFEEGGVNYLKNVICPIVNSQKFNKVIVLDPHSDVLEACLDNFVKINNFELVKFALPNIGGDITLVSPDAGAYKKIFDVAKEFDIQKIITATKVRDIKTGNILHTEIPTLDQHNDISYVIIDDICDGGRTFIELAKVIKDGRPTAKVYLVVTHGIFSAGFGELNKYIDGIFTTNSVKEIGEVEADAYGKIHNTNVNQLNVFLKK
jgi:ribose-phosphate pyrophosphokinase